MAKKPTRLKKLRLTELSLVQSGANQFSSIGIFKAADPVPDPAPAPLTMADMAKALTGASPEVLAVVKSQIEAQNKILEDFKKLNEGNEPVTMSDQNHFYNKLIREHMTKADMSFEDAAMDLQKRRGDKVAQAYQLDENERVRRLKAEADRYNV